MVEAPPASGRAGNGSAARFTCFRSGFDCRSFSSSPRSSSASGTRSVTTGAGSRGSSIPRASPVRPSRATPSISARWTRESSRTGRTSAASATWRWCRRKRGEALSLPDGVVARMQLSPNRIQLAGIQTVPASFRPLERGYESGGVLTVDQGTPVVAVEIPVSQAPWIAVGAAVSIEFPDLPGREPIGGHVRTVTPANAGGWKRLRTTIVLKAPPAEARDGMPVVARFKAPVCAMEPFRSMPHDPPALKPSESRRVYVCPDHAGTIAFAGKLPDRSECAGGDRAFRPPAPSFLVSDASAGHGRSPW